MTPEDQTLGQAWSSSLTETENQPGVGSGGILQLASGGVDHGGSGCLWGRVPQGFRELGVFRSLVHIPLLCEHLASWMLMICMLLPAIHSVAVMFVPKLL